MFPEKSTDCPFVKPALNHAKRVCPVIRSEMRLLDAFPVASLALVWTAVGVLASEFPHHHGSGGAGGGVVVLYHKDPAPFSGDRRFSKAKHVTTSLVPAASIIPAGFVHGRPSCARDLDLCVFNHDYPIEKVQSIVDRHYNQMYDLYHTLYKTPPHEVQWVENYTLAFAAEKQHGSFVCRSEAVYLRIGWAKNWKGLWMTVVNTERFPQVTRVEKCKYRNKPCDYMVPCYKSSCKQREMLYPLIAVNPYDLGQKPTIDLFPIPSGCVCYVDDFRFH
ncbi:neurotrophin 1-like [Haemaphysalis longicornis]